MYYYEITPFVRIPLSSPQAFTYCSRTSLPLGSLVEISIGRRSSKGVVIKETQKPRFFTKEISKVLHKGILTEKQIELAKEVSVKYFTPLGLVLKFFIPKISKLKSAPPLNKFSKKNAALEATTQQKSAIKSILSSPREKTSLLFGPASAGKTEVIIRITEKMLQDKKQSLILIPELFLSEQEIERYTQRLGKNKVIFYNSQCKSSEVRHIYEGVKKGTIKVVISTRMGLFLPFKNLGLIAIDEEQDPSFKQWDQMPHYHTRDVSALLREQHDATLLHCSATPSLEIVRKVEQKKALMVKIPSLSTKTVSVQKPNIEIIDAYKNFKKKTPFVFSKELEKNLTKVLEENKMGLLLVPRRGKSSALLCSDCKLIQKCPSCASSLVHLKDTYKCLRCSYKTSSFSRCKKCNSMRIVDIGFGTDKVADFLKTFFPKARVLTADATTLTNKKTRLATYKKIKNNEVDFVVGTYAIAKGFDMPHIDFVGIINADNWAGKTDFRYDERWMRNLFQLAGRLNRPESSQDGKFIVQTYLQEKKFAPLSEWNWESFYKDALSDRKAVGYPPYGKMIKLIYRNDERKNVEKKVKVLYNWFLETLDNKKIKVSEPFYGNLEKVRNKTQKHLLLTFSGVLPAEISTKLKKLPEGWTIDVDPEFIF